MSMKPVFRQLKHAIGDAGRHLDEKLYQFTQKMWTHLDDFSARVKGIDKYEPKHASPVQRDWKGKWHADTNAQQDLIDRKANGETLPNPDLMLPERYRTEHLSQFDHGGSRIQSREGYQSYGPYRDDPASDRLPAGGDHTTFLMPTDQVQRVLDNANGDVRLIESQLGLEPGSLPKDLVHVEFPTLTSADVRMPSGNETGANDSWIPYGHLPTGISEAVHTDSGLPHVGHDINLK